MRVNEAEMGGQIRRRQMGNKWAWGGHGGGTAKGVGQTRREAERLPSAGWTRDRALRAPTWELSTPRGRAWRSGTGARCPAPALRPSSAPCGWCTSWTTGWSRWWPAARSPGLCSACSERATPRARCWPRSPSDGWTSEKPQCWTVSTTQVCVSELIRWFWSLNCKSNHEVFLKWFQHMGSAGEALLRNPSWMCNPRITTVTPTVCCGVKLTWSTSVAHLCSNIDPF